MDDLANLVCPRTLVYCEGRDAPDAQGAERGFDAKALNNVFCNQRTDILFVSSGGNTELDQGSEVAIAILGKVLPDLQILVLKDRDMASGKKTDENDRQVYLKTNPDNHRVLRRWEIENYLYDKEVLKSYCDEKSLQFDEVSYDALVTDIDNQDLKGENQKIKNFCGIKGPVKPEKFKLELSSHLRPGMEAYRELEACVFDRA